MSDQPGKKAGRWTIGCFILLGFLLVIGLIGGCATWKLFSLTSPSPASLPAFKADPTRHETLQVRANAFQQALKEGQRAELQLDAQDLNTAVALDPQYQEMKGRVFFAIEKDVLSAEVSAPLTAVPLVRSRWLNAHVDLALSLKSGDLSLTLNHVEINGHPAPSKFLQSFSDGFARGFMDALRKDPSVRDALKRLHRVEVEGNHVVIEALPVAGAVARPSVPPKPTMPSVPTVPLVVPESAPMSSPTATTNLPTTNAPAAPGPDRFLGMGLDEVKRQLGPPNMTREEGEAVALQYPKFTLHSADGKTVNRVEPSNE